MNNTFTEDQRLSNLIKREWDYMLQEHPESGTFLGFHTQNDKLSDLSLDSINKFHSHDLEVLEELNTFDKNNLNEDSKLNYDLYRISIEKSIKSFPYKEYLMPINQMGGIQTYFSRLVSMMPFKKEEHFKDYLSRMHYLEKYIDQIIELMNLGISEGLTIPKTGMIDVPNQIKRQLVEDITQSSFYTPIKNANISSELKSELENGIKNKIYKSFSKLATYIEETYLPACRETIGLKDLPNGKELYEIKLEDFTTTKLSAQEIHDIGLKEVERIFKDIQNVMKSVGFDNYEAFLEHLRTAPEFYFKSEEELLMHYRDFSKRVDKELPRFFKVLPRLPYGIDPIPSHQAPSSPTAYYMGSDMNMTRAGIFYANTYQLETRPKYELQALTLHEAVPGHHLQISLALELDNLPEFRKISRFTGYIEGWGLYSEKLGAEMGFYEDPYSKFGQYSFEIWRACRLVVDTGIHYFGWDRSKAIDYLKYYTGKSHDACAVEVDRYIVMPAQATAYKIGEIKILELRQKFEEAKKENFDIREFHDLILRNGALPLSVLEDYVLSHIN
jgi:uncharacterized protein (DUF885 family)